MESVMKGAKRMAAYSLTVDIQAKPGVVWAVMADVTRWHEWTKSIQSIESLDAPELAVGRRYRVRQPKIAPAIWTVTELEPGRRFVWVTSWPALRVTGVHQIEPCGEFVRATLAVKYSGFLGRLMWRLTKVTTAEYVKMESVGLKKRAEAVI